MNPQKHRRKAHSGFTLIETLVAISLLSVAIVAPMALVSQSLSSVVYARDQMTAYYLAQEGIEVIRAIRDSNILASADDLLSPIPHGQNFTVDARYTDPDDVIESCSGACPALQLDAEGNLYGYGPGLPVTRFTRELRADFVDSGQNEIRLEVKVSWRPVGREIRTFIIYENMYRWVDDNSLSTDL